MLLYNSLDKRSTRFDITNITGYFTLIHFTDEDKIDVSIKGEIAMNKTRELCEFLASMTPEMVGQENLRDIRYKTLDWVGCTVAAQNKACTVGARTVLLDQGGNPQASAVGVPEKVSSQQAAFYNGMISHVLEYDDTNKIAITHPGAPVIAAALAAAEACGASFLQYAMGVAVGYEAMIRLGGAVNPNHYEFWHTTGTCGTFAAAATAGRILGLDAAGMERAMGIASTMASGLVYVFGTDAKLVTVGNAARNGLVAAQLALQGFTAPEDSFAGSKAYAKSANGKSDLSFMVPQQGDRLMLEDAYYKMHASCGHTHSALDALQALLAEHPVTLDDVDSVEVCVYRTAMELCSAYQTETESRAKFSMPFVIANMLRSGRCTLSEFRPEVRQDAALREWAISRITILESQDYTADYPQLRKEKVILHLCNGNTLEKQVDLPKGKPPYGFIEQKFSSLAEMVVSHECAEVIKQTLLSISDDEPLENMGAKIRELY